MRIKNTSLQRGTHITAAISVRLRARDMMRWIILTEFLAGTANKLLSLESQAPRDAAEFTNLKTTVEAKIQFKTQMTHESKSSTQPVQKKKKAHLLLCKI